MKILYAINDLKIGGAEKQLILIANKMAENNKVYVLTLWDRGILKKDLSKKIEYISLNAQKNNFIKVFMKLLKILTKINADIVHSRLFYISFILKIAGFFKKIKLIISQESLDLWRNPFINIIDSILDFKVYKYCCVSEEVQNKLIKNIKIDSKKTIIIPNSIILNKKVKKYNNGKIGFLGRNNYAKGIDLFFNYIEKSKENNYTVWTDEYGSLENKFFNNIEVGRIDIEIFFDNIDILVLTSRWEGFPVTVLESAMFGVPVICYENNGIKSVFKDILLYYKDWDDLNKIIEKLRNNKVFYYKCSDLLQNFVNNNFKIENNIKKFIKLYENI
ncbi:MAG: glycosyltransferase [Candidatus Muirbacterium halophilum]|nr:glycosyltransferase [Candidatus Muirbacterium halophilum]MCK9475264.1 glycosyltransferase [Candidatus Muirbacterium halophilum]